MKRTLLAAMLLVGLMGAETARAANSYDFTWTLNDVFGDPYSYDMQGDFSDSAFRFIMQNGGTKHPELVPPGAGLVYDNGGITVAGLNYDAIPGLFTELSGIHSDITSLGSSKANVSHTHTASQITDFNSAVDARISSGTPMTFGTTTRALNTAFRVSSTSSAFVSYTVDIGATLSLTAGDTGTVTLQYADDSAFTTNVKTVQSSANGNTGTLTIGLGLTQTTTASLTGIIPKGKYVRIATANTSGTPSFTWRGQQEVLLPFN